MRGGFGNSIRRPKQLKKYCESHRDSIFFDVGNNNKLNSCADYLDRWLEWWAPCER
jgi:hypothetical protein